MIQRSGERINPIYEPMVIDRELQFTHPLSVSQSVSRRAITTSFTLPDWTHTMARINTR